MSSGERIDELERRLREMEARLLRLESPPYVPPPSIERPATTLHVPKGKH